MNGKCQKNFAITTSAAKLGITLQGEILPSFRTIAAVAMLALGAFVVALPARAEMPLQAYEHYMSGKAGRRYVDAATLYLTGFMESVRWAMSGADEKLPLPFCLKDPQPGFAEIKAIVQEELAARPDWRKQPDVLVATVAMEGLRKRYPCR